MVKIRERDFIVTSPLLKKERKIAYISDVHGDYKTLKIVIDYLKNELGIKTLIIGGDLVDQTTDTINNDEILTILEEFAKDMDIFIALGNHDLIRFEGRVEKESDTFPFLDELRKIKNVFLPPLPIKGPTVSKISLNNDIEIGTINYPFNYYQNREKEEDFQKLMKTKDSINFSDDKYGILVCHSPKHLFSDLLITKELQENPDLILCGHMHGGLKSDKNRSKKENCDGIAGPYASLFPKNAWGLYKCDIPVMISGGITKIALSSEAGSMLKINGVKNIISDTFKPEIEIFNLTPAFQNNIVLDSTKIIDYQYQPAKKI